MEAAHALALAAQARLYESSGREAEALGLYNRAFGLAPQREDLARAQMTLYLQSGQPDRAHHRTPRAYASRPIHRCFFGSFAYCVPWAHNSIKKRPT